MAAGVRTAEAPVLARNQGGVRLHRQSRFDLGNQCSDSGTSTSVRYDINFNDLSPETENGKQHDLQRSPSTSDNSNASENLFGPSPHLLWQANRVVPDSFIGGRRLPNNPLGLNGYSNVHDIAFFSALNPSPAHCRFLEDRGLTSEQIGRMGYCSTLYQAVMRTSLRNLNNLDRKRIVVMDRRAADYLVERLPGSALVKLETGIIETVRKTGRPRIHTDNAEKSRKQRDREKEARRKMMQEMMALPISQDHNGVAGSNEANLRVENTIDLIRHFDTQLPYQGTIFTHKKSGQPEWYLYCENHDAFIRMMEFCSQQQYPAKENNELISPAIFDPERVVFDSSGKRLRRGRGNIVYLQNIMLDFEKGDLRPEQFAAQFPDLQMVITNTWGHTNDNPRFRVIILTTRQMTPDVYEALFDEIVQRMADQGVVRTPAKGSNFRKSGLDYSKRTAASLFYLPCQAQIASESFFDLYLEPERKPVDPEVWMETARLIVKDDDESFTIQPQLGEYDQTRLEAAINKWRYETPPGEGNHRFGYDYRLGRRSVRIRLCVCWRYLQV
jgi:hypothetical protein